MVAGCLRRGLARALFPPGLLVLGWSLQLATALPAGLLVFQEVEQAIGGSLVHERLRHGMDLTWLGEVQEQARGPMTTFTPPALGRTAFLMNLEASLWGDLFVAPAGLVAAGVAFALLWVFFLGGALGRFTLDGGLRPATFCTAAGRNFGRLARLAALSAAAHGALWLAARELFPLLEGAMGPVTEERAVFAVYASAAALLSLVFCLLELLFSFAKIVAVADGQRRAWPALRRAVTFVASNWRPAVGLTVLFAVASLALLALQFGLDPGVAQSGAWSLGGFLLFAQAFLIARLGLRLGALAAQTDLYLKLSRRAPSPRR